MAEIFGILNITTDSFSDGGKFLNPDDAIQQGTKLLQEGADWLDVSGQSSNINASLVSEEEEWKRVEPVIRHFVPKGVRISLDSFRPSVQKKGIEAGVRCINDITGFTYEGDRSFLSSYVKKHPELKLIIMHSHNRNIAKSKSNLTPEKVVRKIQTFFRDRRSDLVAMDIPESILYFDPGMGFFLSEDPMVSFRVLQELEILKLEFPQLMVGVSRKSFLGNVLGELPIADREFATLACELHLLRYKIPFIRTHNVLKLRQAEKIWNLCQEKD
ncbi:dihydropteroate synthase [Leptospira congkakensis]|uniref:Dihydropteroate synthase n=1 Tax=Leptospira congkakensis TaxID=2484932 RepID=A0A4Z1A0N3_9LEPT|nr:dihydropteroate synthase [Leptospira congkakensis]TGL86816.1 dihydropteroate synthase [Leptospira congkakensis]TGL93640.1 dihydropteroate synthase [Leptospira congkakensis]TGL94954.1 dihydropteroate synthase [Leptospira congkakensis]